MISGRIVWGIVQFTLMRLAGNAFTLKMFLAGALFNAIPGIIIQLIFIPTVMVALDRAKLVPFRNTRNSKEKMRAV